MDSDKLNASDDGSFSEFVSDLEGQVLDLMKKTNKAPSDAWQSWMAFSSAINWNENWIRSLMVFYVFLFLVIILTRKRLGIQSCIFFFIAILVRLAETINTYCYNHWQDFSTQNYFDKNGLFAGTVYAAPLLTICLMMLLNFLAQASSALIVAKRLELKHSKTK